MRDEKCSTESVHGAKSEASLGEKASCAQAEVKCEDRLAGHGGSRFMNWFV